MTSKDQTYKLWNNAIKMLTFKEKFNLFLWIIFKRYKANKFVVNLQLGMHGSAAYKYAKDFKND
jgi:hypothetical protein